MWLGHKPGSTVVCPSAGQMQDWLSFLGTGLLSSGERPAQRRRGPFQMSDEKYIISAPWRHRALSLDIKGSFQGLHQLPGIMTYEESKMQIEGFHDNRSFLYFP